MFLLSNPGDGKKSEKNQLILFTPKAFIHRPHHFKSHIHSGWMDRQEDHSSSPSHHH